MISTHVLDTSIGKPAEGIEVVLERLSGDSKDSFQEVARGKTNADGRHSFECGPIAGTYRLTFGIADYLEKTQSEFFSSRLQSFSRSPTPIESTMCPFF